MQRCWSGCRRRCRCTWAHTRSTTSRSGACTGPPRPARRACGTSALRAGGPARLAARRTRTLAAALQMPRVRPHGAAGSARNMHCQGAPLQEQPLPLAGLWCTQAPASISLVHLVSLDCSMRARRGLQTLCAGLVVEEEEDVEEEEQAEAGEDADVHGSMDAEQPDAPDGTAAWQAGRRMRRQLDSPLDMNLRYAAAGGDACFSRLDTCSHVHVCYASHLP